jgi:putative exporter of polyketide antibiotics
MSIPAKTQTVLYMLYIVLLFTIVPTLLIIFRDWINVVIFILSLLYCFIIVTYETYKEVYLFVSKEQREDEEAYHRFNNDPEKIRFYKGFKKYFRGDLTIEQLKHYFIHHPRK